jgi:hypothetical protein
MSFVLVSCWSLYPSGSSSPSPVPTEYGITHIHPIINPEYDALGELVSIYVPEIGESVTYEAYQNIAGIDNLCNAIFDDIDLGLATISNSDRDLSPTIKNYMREKDTRIMFFDIDGYKCANLRLTNPETFWFIEYFDSSVSTENTLTQQLLLARFVPHRATLFSMVNDQKFKIRKSGC